MRIQPTIKIVHQDEYDPAETTDIDEIIEHERRGLDSGEFEVYRIEVYVGSELAAECDSYVASAGYVGEYETTKEITDEFLRESANNLVMEAVNSMEAVSFYVVATSPASARWAWEANLKNGSHVIMSDDKDFAETEAKYESTKHRARKGLAGNTPDKFKAYEITLVIKEA